MKIRELLRVDACYLLDASSLARPIVGGDWWSGIELHDVPPAFNAWREVAR